MAKLTKTPGYKDGKALVQEMTKALKGTPYKPKDSTAYSFYLYLPDRKRATACGKTLKADGYETEVEKSAMDDGKWLCLCHATLALTDKTILKLGDRLVQLAKDNEGEFDGWEVNPYETPGALDDLMSLIEQLQKEAAKAKKPAKPGKKTKAKPTPAPKPKGKSKAKAPKKSGAKPGVTARAKPKTKRKAK